MPWFFKILFIFNWDRKKIFWTLVQKQTCVCLCFERVALRKWGTQVHMSILPHLRCRFLASLLLIQETEGFSFSWVHCKEQHCIVVQLYNVCVLLFIYWLTTNQHFWKSLSSDMKCFCKKFWFLQNILFQG